MSKTSAEIAQEIISLWPGRNIDSLKDAFAVALDNARDDALQEAVYPIAGGGSKAAIEKMTPLAAWAKGVDDHAAYVNSLKRRP